MKTDRIAPLTMIILAITFLAVVGFATVGFVMLTAQPQPSEHQFSFAAGVEWGLALMAVGSGLAGVFYQVSRE